MKIEQCFISMDDAIVIKMPLGDWEKQYKKHPSDVFCSTYMN